MAAGEGQRMRSSMPKVLHELAGRPLLRHVCDAACALSPSTIRVVHGSDSGLLRNCLADLEKKVPLRWLCQEKPSGTGDAVLTGLTGLEDADRVLVLCGDVPGLRPETLRQLLAAAPDGLTVLTAHLVDAGGYGRLVRDAGGHPQRIVEERDAVAGERAIHEVFAGVLAATAGDLRRWLAAGSRDNAQGELYLTGVLAAAVAEGYKVESVSASGDEIRGVNTRRQLADLEREWQQEQARRLMDEGVSLLDPARFDLRGRLQAGADTVIDINVVLIGEVQLGRRVRIGPHCLIRDSVLGDDVCVLSHSVIEQARIGSGCRIGPFARVRPEVQLSDNVCIGNFVELKKADIGPGVKINHLSYVGDAEVGEESNLGCGTVTCNYDGASKHRTVIGRRVFIGANSQLVAPLSVGDGATIGAGSTITRDVEPKSLAVSRSRQTTRPGWKRPGADD